MVIGSLRSGARHGIDTHVAASLLGQDLVFTTGGRDHVAQGRLTVVTRARVRVAASPAVAILNRREPLGTLGRQHLALHAVGRAAHGRRERAGVWGGEAGGRERRTRTSPMAALREARTRLKIAETCTKAKYPK